MNQSTHDLEIVNQFTKQAIPFTNKPEHSNQNAFDLLFKLTEVSSKDTVLDVACGSGLVACAFAKIASQVTGIDLTPAMIERARSLQKERHLNNLTWQLGTVLPLPYLDSSFSLVATRYSFHHFLNPEEVLSEMKRVCIPGGKVAVIDVTPAPDKADAYNQMEKLRDPSHAKALTLDRLQEMAKQVGLINLKTEFYRLEMELEKQLKASFPTPEDADRIRQLFEEDLTADRLGVNSDRKGAEIYFTYPISIVVGQVPISS